MGDTGSLTIGIIAVLAIAVRKIINSVVVWCFSRKFIGRNPG
jgi:UDP-N-acetylmuramyl pentapeptide phosphotransferase/UDP-N-acetylglucosamine-1-phosphate transferase